MIASYPSRHFQLWEYNVSHGSLLVRSPRKPTIPTNIDLIFVGVEFVCLPRHLRGILLSSASLNDVEKICETLGRKVEASKVFVLVSEENRFFVVASGYKFDENEADIFHSPLKK